MTYHTSFVTAQTSRAPYFRRVPRPIRVTVILARLPPFFKFMCLQPYLSHHDRETARSYRILEKARQKAFKKDGYNSETTRHCLTDLFHKRFDGGEPRLWQLDVSEAIILGLDSLLICSPRYASDSRREKSVGAFLCITSNMFWNDVPCNVSFSTSTDVGERSLDASASSSWSILLEMCFQMNSDI